MSSITSVKAVSHILSRYSFIKLGRSGNDPDNCSIKFIYLGIKEFVNYSVVKPSPLFILLHKSGELGCYNLGAMPGGVRAALLI